MNRRYLLPLALIAAALAVPATANTAPSPVRISVASNAQYVSPTTILLAVTITCPAGQPFYSQASVFEPSTNANGFGLTPFPLPFCTGSAQTVVLTIGGGPFAPGKAYVSALVFAAGFEDTAQRQVQIVL
jgi:hypothetical protein